MADDVHRLTEMGRIMGMSSRQRALWRNTLMSADTLAARQDVARSFLDSMLTTAGMRQSDEWPQHLVRPVQVGAVDQDVT